MGWTRRLLVAFPFAIACVLNVLMIAADRLHLHREHIAGYGFLFASPWGWVLDFGWFPNIHNRWLRVLSGYAVILWVPAALYSGCLWLLLVGLRNWSARRTG
jgi:hypothetical protein